MVCRPLPLTHLISRSVSAWQERQPTVTSDVQPPLIYDYYGFPEESYKIKYDAPGSPQLAQRIFDLLKAAGLSCVFDSKRGWDHGVFVPLKLLYPAADIPIVEMSMLKSLSAEDHLKLGEALAPLRDEGVMIVGSGLSYHNMRGFVFRGRGDPTSTKTASQEFDAYIQDALLNPEHSPQQRRQLLLDWEQGPSARLCHPTEEHLLPLMVAAGAAHYGQAQVTFDEELLGAKVSGYIWN
ncbi:MAG: aromatic ring-opening dioxygenase catalytic subunit [Trebouxia sp. A1-2]|nr:MAG: aromatic ring-opening dioxygenase catalytic subunit [Trebouxia sp. A1-2]